jgi:anthranilate synthase component 1
VTYAEFEVHVAAHRPPDGRRLAVPVAVRRSADLLTPVAAYLALRGRGETAFLLESVEGGERLGRYSFLGARPALVVEARGARVRLHRRSAEGAAAGDGSVPVETAAGGAFDVLDGLLRATAQAPVPGLPAFTGGAVGFFGYDCARALEKLPGAPPDALGLPDAVWAFYDAVAAFDHVRHQLVLMATAFVDEDTDLPAAYAAARERLVELEEELAHRPAEPGEPVRLLADAPRSNVTREAFEAAVRTAQDHIREGDVFQLVLSQRLAVPFAGDPFNLYRALRQVNPSPHLFHLDFSGLDSGPFSLVGSSPERLVRVTPQADGGARAEVLPIAGTRRRGATPAEDAALEAELAADPKERAEHLMLVDLGRNDLGRVCATGTVEVERYATVERFSHVMHLVSSVAGTVAGRSAVEVLAACFPAGTVSGAPKVRAMQLIDALETERRGPYAGAVGYAGYDGALDTALAIRTLVVLPPDSDAPGTAYVQAGAGVVADSDPAAEYEETLHKAHALVEALGLAASDLL